MRIVSYKKLKATAMGYDTVVIFGSPPNYVSSGFVSCKKHNVCVEGGRFPAAMLVKELKAGALDGRKWYYKDSPVLAAYPRNYVFYWLCSDFKLF